MGVRFLKFENGVKTNLYLLNFAIYEALVFISRISCGRESAHFLSVRITPLT